MADVYDLYPQPNAAAMNPLAQMGQIQNLIGTMNQNKLFAQQFSGQQAFGEAIKKFTNPLTGETDWPSLMGALANDPRAAYKLPEIAQQQLARRQTELAMFGTGQDQAKAGYAAVNAALLPLMSNPKASPVDAFAAIRDGYVRGQVPDQVFKQMMSSVPTDPAEFSSWLKQQSVQALDPQSASQLLFPEPTTIDTGDAIQAVLANRLTGQMTPTGEPFRKGLSPSELSQPLEIAEKDPRTGQPTGRMITITRRQLLERNGGVPQGGRASDQSVPPANQNGGQGQPRMPAGTGVGMPPAAAVSGGGMSGGTISKISPAEEAASREVGTGSGKAINEMYDSAADTGERIFQLQKALNSLAQTKTGPGTAQLNEVKSFFNTMAPQWAKVFGAEFDPEKIKNFDEARKYLEQYARSQAKDTGVSADSLASALTANASTSISQLAAQDVVRANIGLEKYRQARAQAWGEAGLPEKDFNKWKAQWVRENDPRAYVFSMLPPGPQDTILQNMNRKQLKDFLRTQQWARNNGYLD